MSLCRTGRSYYRWSLSRGAESGFPQPISNWAGVPFPVDAALQYSVNSRTYFFVRRNYYRIDDSAFAVSIATNFASLTCAHMEEFLYLTSAFTVSDACWYRWRGSPVGVPASDACQCISSAHLILQVDTSASYPQVSAVRWLGCTAYALNSSLHNGSHSGVSFNNENDKNSNSTAQSQISDYSAAGARQATSNVTLLMSFFTTFCFLHQMS